MENFKLNIRINTTQQIQSHYHIDHTTKAMNMNVWETTTCKLFFQNNQAFIIYRRQGSSICPKYFSQLKSNELNY